MKALTKYHCTKCGSVAYFRIRTIEKPETKRERCLNCGTTVYKKM